MIEHHDNFSNEYVDADSICLYPLNNTTGIVASLNTDYIEHIRANFTFRVKNCQFFPAVRAGLWDGLIRFIKTNGEYPIGLTNDIIEVVKKWNERGDKVKCKLFGSLVPKTINIDNLENVIRNELINKQTNKLEPWDHQWETIKKLLIAKRGIARSATSSGKSYVMAMITKYLIHCGYVKKALVIEPLSDLVVQMSREYAGFGFSEKDIGMYFGQVKDKNNPVTISTWQSLQHIEENEFFEDFDLVIIDECFTKNSKVLTENGEKNIQDLIIGEKIWSFNELTKQKELKEIEKIYHNRSISNKLIELELENGKIIKCTPNHLFYTTNRGLVMAIDLKENDDILNI